MFKHILIATDLERTSDPAGRLAVALAREQGAELTLVHVYVVPPEAYAPLPSSALAIGPEDLRRSAEAALRDWARRIEAPVGAQAIARAGDPATVLLQELASNRADLLVVGTHGRRGLAHVLVGSTAEKLVRLSPVPVLSVRAPKGAS